jgi:hypothetical protein
LEKWCVINTFIWGKKNHIFYAAIKSTIKICYIFYKYFDNIIAITIIVSSHNSSKFFSQWNHDNKWTKWVNCYNVNNLLKNSFFVLINDSAQSGVLIKSFISSCFHKDYCKACNTMAFYFSTFVKMINFCLKSNLILVLFTITYSLSAAKGKDYLTSYFEIEKIFHIPTYDDDVSSTRERSLVSCICQCQILESPSFYYVEENSTCFCCFGYAKNTSNQVAVTSGIIHGIRTDTMSTTYIQVRIFISLWCTFYVDM